MIEKLFGARKISWRRLFAFAVATGLLVGGYVDAWVWLVVAGLFVGGEIGEKIAAGAVAKAGAPGKLAAQLAGPPEAPEDGEE